MKRTRLTLPLVLVALLLFMTLSFVPAAVRSVVRRRRYRTLLDLRRGRG